MSWGAITFTPTASQLESLRALKGMSSIRIQGSRSHATFDRVNKSIADAKNLGFQVAWGPMDGPDDYPDLEHYVRTSLSSMDELPALVVFDAELLNPQYAMQGPEGPAHYYNLHVMPAVATAQSFGLHTAGPGTTHTPGEDELGLGILEGVLVNPGINNQMHIPSIHWYVDKGWLVAEARLQSWEASVRMLGWQRAHVTETGAHGDWLRSLDGWGCGKDRRPTENRQLSRGEGIVSHFAEREFFDQRFWYQVSEDWHEPPDRWYGLLDPAWNQKMVCQLWA